MVKSFLITGSRNIIKNKTYSIISILGLAISLSATLFLGAIIYTELTFDSFHKNSKNIYRLTFDEAPSGRPGARHFAKASPPAGPELKAAFPEIENYVRLRFSEQDILSFEDKQFYEFGLFYADSSFFKVFSFELKQGDKHTALSLANSIVISQKIAQKYFGNLDPIGKVLKLNNDGDFVVTGVLEELPPNSHIQADILLPFHAFKVPFGYPVDLNSWSWPSFNTYLLLREGVDATMLEQKFVVYVKKSLPEEISKRFAFRIQPLSEVYFSELRANEMKSGNKAFVSSLVIVGVVLILLASLNFINLNSTRLLIRGKESAIRKVMGASKISFYKQFVSESSLLTLASGIFGFILVYSLDDQLQLFFNTRHAKFELLLLIMAALVIAFCLVLGLMAGIYPAFASSKIEIAKAAKGALKSGKQANRLRGSLVLIQFVVTAALVGCVVLVNQQLDYVSSKDLGFDKSNVLVLDAPADQLTQKGELLKSELIALPLISGVGFSGADLNGNNGNVPIYPEGNEFPEGYPMSITGAKPGWLESLNIELLSGHGLSDKIPIDSSEIVINETAAKIFKWTGEEAIGKRLRVGEIMSGVVVGVVKDFNMASLHREIAPLVLTIPRTHVTKVYVRFKQQDFNSVIQQVRKTYEAVLPSTPFYFTFLDQALQNQYEKEENFQKLLFSFSLIAVIIATTGIYAFVAYVVKLKAKETALRKVLGGSQTGVYWNLVRPFILLVVIGNVLAIPMSLRFIDGWLNSFAYKVNIDPLLFFWVLLGLLVIVLATSFAPVYKTLTVNPVKFLRED